MPVYCTSSALPSIAPPEQCWGGPERSLTVSLECGSEDEVVNVDEPEKCTYTAVLRTPAACRADALASLEAELKAMS